MNIAKLLRDEVKRRGWSATQVAEGAGLPFSTVSEFLRGVREIGTDKASKIATLLGFNLVISKLRKKEMSEYMEQIKDFEKRGVSFDDETMEMAQEFVQNLNFIFCEFGDWEPEDAELANEFVVSLQELEQHGWDTWSKDDVKAAAGFVRDLTWLEEHGWEARSEDDAKSIAEFVQNLKTLEAMGEEATPARIAEVAELVENLKKVKNRKR